MNDKHKELHKVSTFICEYEILFVFFANERRKQAWESADI